MQLVRALTLRLKKPRASPLTPLYIAGEENYVTDIPSRSFGSDSSLKKIIKKEAVWATFKNVLGFEFDVNPGEHTIWITEDRRTDILTKLKKLIR